MVKGLKARDERVVTGEHYTTDYGFFDNGRWQEDAYNDKPFCFRAPEKAKEIHPVVQKLGYKGKEAYISKPKFLAGTY